MQYRVCIVDEDGDRIEQGLFETQSDHTNQME